MVLKLYLGILLIVLFSANEFLIIVLAKELFAKALQSFETCVLVNNDLCGELFSSLESPATFDVICNVQHYFSFQILIY